MSNLNLEVLRKSFEKVARKNELIFDLNKAIEQQLEKMVKKNPSRKDFYERYKEIVEQYNNDKLEA